MDLTRIVKIQDIKNFLFAGRATITLKSGKSGTHFTFRVNSKKNDPKSPFFVSVLSGSDNYSNYTYIGIITNDKKTFKHTQNSKVSTDAPSFIAFNYFFKLLSQNQVNPAMEIYHSGKCGRCGRKLTTPDSIERGIGPFCAGQI